MANVALFPHKPSEETLAFIRSLSGEWKAYQYLFHVEQLKDLETGIIELVDDLNRKLDLERASRILIGLPGLAAAGPLLVEAISACNGRPPELLIMVRGAGGSYIPCPEKPIIELCKTRGAARKKRSEGFIDLGGSAWDEPLSTAFWSP